ncbi:hypothetical protein B0J11DRAFT_474636 [Dendryphion nanum]|uniref:SIS domain-containing protein n=1 Tax=Dendryphion nanum TaxID=256645 RepID=A0A9P9CYN1_9PLEO|nr:hypothetical protein B0J11DRAFT_474636 [Dendryphion nanum]
MFSCPAPEDSPPRILKRKRSTPEPLTPPLSLNDSENARLLDRAVHVLSTAATALSQVTFLYQSDPVAQDGLVRAVDCVTNVNDKGGKLIICGVGKSGLIGGKMVATMKSLGLGASFLHAAEAIHGDLGDIRGNDAVLFISYSGKTSELLTVLDHIPESVPILAITSQTNMSECVLLEERPDAILLPAPIHELEEVSFGVCAPTTSTTVAIAIGDMLALTVADNIHRDDTKRVFKRNHPGGAIGARARNKARTVDTKVEVRREQNTGLVSPA